MPTGLAFSSRRSPRDTSPYKCRLHKGAIAGDNRLRCILHRAGTAHTRNQRHPGESAILGQPGLLLGSHQWKAFPGTLPGSSTELSSQQHLGPPQLLCLQGSLGLLLFLRAQQQQAFAGCSTTHTQGRGHGGIVAAVTRATGLPQDTNRQLNTPAASDNLLGTSQGCTRCLWDYTTEISNTLPSRFCLPNV